MNLVELIQIKNQYKLKPIDKIKKYIKKEYNLTLSNNEIDISKLKYIKPIIELNLLRKNTYIVFSRNINKYGYQITEYTTDQYNFKYINNILVPISIL